IGSLSNCCIQASERTTLRTRRCAATRAPHVRHREHVGQRPPHPSQTAAGLAPTRINRPFVSRVVVIPIQAAGAPSAGAAASPHSASVGLLSRDVVASWLPVWRVCRASELLSANLCCAKLPSNHLAHRQQRKLSPRISTVRELLLHCCRARIWCTALRSAVPTAIHARIDPTPQDRAVLTAGLGLHAIVETHRSACSKLRQIYPAGVGN
ncbi:hypothetical protein CB0940_04023, partial [Cercospora beticola]